MASARHPEQDGRLLHRRPSTTAYAHHHERDGHCRRPSTTASAQHHAEDALRHRRPSTTASAHHHAADALRHRHPSTTACAHHPEQDGPLPCRRPWTRASAHHPEQDGPLLYRRPSTTASAHHHAAVGLRPHPAVPRIVHRRADLEEHPRNPARTQASRHRVHAQSARIRGPGPRAGCLDRMSRSLCSCRPRGPDAVCGVVGRAEVKDQANGCEWTRASPRVPRSSRATARPARSRHSEHGVRSEPAPTPGPNRTAGRSPRPKPHDRDSSTSEDALTEARAAILRGRRHTPASTGDGAECARLRRKARRTMCDGPSRFYSS
jgi:hypothetical protein